MVGHANELATLPSINVRPPTPPMAEVVGNAPVAKNKFSWGQLAKNSFNSRKTVESPSGSPRAYADEGPQSPRTPRRPLEQLGTKSPPKSPPKSPKSFFSSKTQAKQADRSRLLVNVNVLGSPGPLRFLVDADESVHRVIEMALRAYAREDRLPILGTSSSQYELYCSCYDSEALDHMESIGKLGARQFVLFRKKQETEAAPVQAGSQKTRWWNMMKGSKAVTSY
eukprot:TRINITY_DN8427_c0_g1_i1.p1 TRINITY_DN8427_c0_g1~~TRINITY_DN8427_c0_g1_i1.p1  ORF type:complete len:225 (-),score=34.94 TRINITY_DN8427_c0_g1_i1:416-1090(-)